MNRIGKLLIRKFHKFNITLAILLALVSNMAWAQSFVARTSTNKVAKGQPFQVSFSMENVNGGEYQAPKFSGFQIVSGPNQSQQISLVNGNFSRSVSISYFLVATKTGTLTIDEAFIRFKNGNAISTKPITIEVVEGNVAQQNNAAARGGNNNTGNNNAPQDVEELARNNVFMRASVSKTNAYKGEQLTVTYKLYTAVNLAQYAIKEMPQLNGFWSKDIITPDKTQITEEVLNGKRYKVGIFKKTVLFPQKSGLLKIDPLKVDVVAQVPVRQKRRNPFADDPFFNDDFFEQFFSDFGVGYQNIPLNLASESISVNVKDLPNPQPEGFTGAVGKFTAQSSVNTNQTKTDEPITLKLTVSGTGNLSMIEPPKIDLGENFETFDPKTKENIDVGEIVRGSKTIEYIILPRSAGKFTLPSIRFSYFDAAQKQYKSTETQAIDILVTQNENSTSANVSNNSTTIPLHLKNDIGYIHENIQLNGKSSQFFGSGGFWALMFLPLLAIFGVILYKRRNKNFDPAFAKYNKAQKVALLRLKKADFYLKNKQAKAFHEEVIQSIWGYLGDKFGLSNMEMERNFIQNKLSEAGQNEHTILKLFQVLDNCEMSLYANVSDEQEWQKTYNQSVEVITEMEQVNIKK